MLVFALSSISVSNAQKIDGTWNWNSDKSEHMSSIVLESSDNKSYSGYYCSVFYDGSKIDCDEEDTMTLYLKMTEDNVLVGTFKSSCCGGSGAIRLVYEETTKRLWISLSDTRGEFYLPNKVYYEQ